jgi:hypothetical protein
MLMMMLGRLLSEGWVMVSYFWRLEVAEFGGRVVSAVDLERAWG